jgi:hypothetical protein
MGALLDAQRAAAAEGAPPPDAVNTHHGYDYISGKALAAWGRRILTDAGLVLAVFAGEIRERRVATTGPTQRDGSATVLESSMLELARTYCLAHPASGESLSWVAPWPIVTTAGKEADKAAGAAATLGLAYVMRGLLGLADTVDVERGGDSQPIRSQRPAPAPAPRPRAAAPPRVKPRAAPAPKAKPKPAPAPLPNKEKPARQEDDIAIALGMGVTPSSDPSTLSAAAVGLLPDLPTDPRADDLEGQGWPRDVAEDLCQLEAARQVHRDTLNQLVKVAARERGEDLRDFMSKTGGPAWDRVGVTLSEGDKPNGYQARLWAASLVLREGAPA